MPVEEEGRMEDLSGSLPVPDIKSRKGQKLTRGAVAEPEREAAAEPQDQPHN